MKNSDCYQDITHTLVGKIDMNILFSYKHKSDRDFSIKKLSLKESMNSYLLSYKKLKSISLLERPLFKFDKNIVINFYKKK